jgi:hypothetical protein
VPLENQTLWTVSSCFPSPATDGAWPGGSFGLACAERNRKVLLLQRLPLTANLRLHFFTDECKHPDYPTEECKVYFTELTLPFLQ